MKVKNETLIRLSNSGILSTTEHDVPVADAYKASKFRRELQRVIKDLADKEKEIYKDAGIEDPAKFNDADKDKQERWKALHDEFLKDESEMDVKVMSYESFHALAKENRQTPMQVPAKDKEGKDTTQIIYTDPYRACEDLLENLLWEAPKEEE